MVAQGSFTVAQGRVLERIERGCSCVHLDLELKHVDHRKCIRIAEDIGCYDGP